SCRTTLLRGALNRPHDAHVRAASAQNAVQCVLDIVAAGLRVVVEQCLGRHDHAVHAIAALHRLLIDESLLERVRFIDASQALERGDLVACRGRQRHDTGSYGRAVHDNGAVHACGQAAAEFRPMQFEVVAQRVQQHAVGRRIDHMILAVDIDGDGIGHELLFLTYPLRSRPGPGYRTGSRHFQYVRAAPYRSNRQHTPAPQGHSMPQNPPILDAADRTHYTGAAGDLMTTQYMNIEDFDLQTLPQSFYDHPYATYAALRSVSPVHRLPDGSFFLTRYADLDRVYRDTATFSSEI